MSSVPQDIGPPNISLLVGIDPQHPMVSAFDGVITQLPAWTRDELDMRDGDRIARDPGPGVYLYMFSVGSISSLGEIVYIGITRNPHIRFRQHRKTRWWRRITHAYIDRIDCRYHDGDVCTVKGLDRSARMLETWMIDLFEPTENLILSQVI